MSAFRIQRLAADAWRDFMVSIPSASDGRAHLGNLAANERSCPEPAALRLVDPEGAEVCVWHPGMVVPATPVRDVKPVPPPAPAKKKRSARKKGPA